MLIDIPFMDFNMAVLRNFVALRLSLLIGCENALPKNRITTKKESIFFMITCIMLLSNKSWPAHHREQLQEMNTYLILPMDRYKYL